LTIASGDLLVQQPNGIITREVEATHRLRRGIVVTSDDCIAIETFAIIHSKSNSATHAGPTPAMATVITAVAAFSAVGRIVPPPPNIITL
jgi:hypothetical protein